MEFFGIVSIIVIIVGALAVMSYLFDINDWNAGLCKSCDQSWRSFGVDSTGSRGYTCDDCSEIVWIYWESIDR